MFVRIDRIATLAQIKIKIAEDEEEEEGRVGDGDVVKVKYPTLN